MDSVMTPMTSFRGIFLAGLNQTKRKARGRVGR